MHLTRLLPWWIYCLKVGNSDLFGELPEFTEQALKDWCSHNADLFIGELEFPIEVTSANPRPGFKLIEVPMYKDKQRTIEAVSIYLNYLYQSEIDTVPEPKFTLYGNITEATINRVLKAVYAHWYSDHTQTDAVIALMLNKLNPFDWKMSDSDLLAYKRGTLKKTLFNSSKVKLLVRAKQDFDNLVKNAAQGRFPDFR